MKIVTKNSEQITVDIGEVFVFVNIPRPMTYALSADLVADVEQQVLQKFARGMANSSVIPKTMTILGAHRQTGCIIIGISIGVALKTAGALMALVAGYPKVRAGLRQIAGDIESVNIRFDNEETVSPQKAVHYKTTLPQPDDKDLAAIEQALRDLDSRS